MADVYETCIDKSGSEVQDENRWLLYSICMNWDSFNPSPPGYPSGYSRTTLDTFSFLIHILTYRILSWLIHILTNPFYYLLGNLDI